MIGLITPLRNEAQNIHQLFDAIDSQTVPINYWIIIENDSDDGSKEILEQQKKRLDNVDNLKIINLKFDNKTYELGSKYASIINYGFEYLKRIKVLDSLDFVGILDSDCFPQSSYYEELTKYMRSDPKLGISSGIIYDFEGNADIASKDWVRGGCRLWSISCFKDVGYFIGPSADTLSAIKAVLRGWNVYTNPDLKVYSRKLGSRVNFSYYGYSSYYRGHTLIYALLKTIKLISKGEITKGKEYISGYSKALLTWKPRVEDKEIRKYFKYYISNSLFHKSKLRPPEY